MRRVFGCLAALGLIAVAPRATASVGEAMGLAELVREADVVVLGTATERRSRWAGRHIVTDVTIRVDEDLGEEVEAGSVLTLTHLGGAVGDVGMRVSGMPTFEVGKRTLLFARRGERSGRLWPVGMSQGVMPVRREGGQDMVHPGAPGLVLVKPSATGALRPAPGALLHPRPLEEVLGEVRALLREERDR